MSFPVMLSECMEIDLVEGMMGSANKNGKQKLLL